ncbi:MAG: crossover junction endodeoxyribonuclease RuvC [Elusimicrobia bacterium]|nr:crossover junction endodeoxyribonuclease RuvC [Elusimicrobiota bacterium]
MRILGIDPGLSRTGWSVVEAEAGREPRLDASGLIETASASPLQERLRFLHERLSRVLSDHQPAAAAAEDLFFLKASPSMRSTLEARGVILLACAQAGVSVCAYDPRTVKASLTGSGASGKAQVQRMVQRLLKLAQPLTPDDVADAAAIALCHSKMSRLGGLKVVDRIGGGLRRAPVSQASRAASLPPRGRRASRGACEEGAPSTP